MNTQNNAACTEWSNQLAALHPDDLSSAERAAREAHIASCNTCSTVRRQYVEIAELVRTLPTDTIPEELPVRLVAQWDEEEKQPQSGHFSRPQILSTTSKRRRRGRFVAVLIAAALIMVVVLGSFLVHRGSESIGSQPGRVKSVSSGGLGLSHGGVAMAFERFFSIDGSVIYMPEENGSGLLALDKNTGALIRRYKIGDGKVLDPPVIAGGILYEVDIETSTLYAFRVQDGSAVWHKTFGNRIGPSVSFADGIVYVITSPTDHQVYALQAGNGHVLWHYQTPGTNLEADHVFAANGLAYISSNDENVQHLYALNTTNGRVLWTHQFRTINLGLLTNNGVLYVTSGNTLLALQAESGATLWTYRVDNAIILSAAIVGGNVLYASGNNGYIYALRIKDGTILWRIKVWNNTLPPFPLFLSNGLLLVERIAQTRDSAFLALNAENGQIKWQKNYSFNNILIVRVDNGIIYISSMDLHGMKLAALRAEDGSIIWSKSLNGL